MPITLEDIARKSGFSLSTVSRALNGSSLLSDKTVAKIRKIAKELKYEPNLLAKSLAGQESKTIGYLASELGNQAEQKIILGMEQAAKNKAYNLLICLSYNDMERMRSYERLMSQSIFDGIIVGLSAGHWRKKVFTAKPLVYVDQWPKGTFAGSVVTSDHRVAAEEMADFFRHHGVKSAAYYGKGTSNMVEKTRQLEFARACGRSGIAYRHIVPPTKNLFEGLSQVLGSPNHWPGAVVVEPEMSLESMNKLGPDVTEWMRGAGIGCYDWESGPRSRFFGFDITIVQNHEAMGKCALEILIKLIRKEAVPKVVPIGVHLRTFSGAAHAK